MLSIHISENIGKTSINLRKDGENDGGKVYDPDGSCDGAKRTV